MSLFFLRSLVVCCSFLIPHMGLESLAGVLNRPWINHQIPIKDIGKLLIDFNKPWNGSEILLMPETSLMLSWIRVGSFTATLGAWLDVGGGKYTCTIWRVVVPPCETTPWLQSDGFWQHFIIIQIITLCLQDQVIITLFYSISFIRKIL